jgi:SAM-dependent methyltransferase
MHSRKREETEFHDQLRRGHEEQRWSAAAEAQTADNPAWSNFKYYSVERKSLSYVSDWLAQHVPGQRVLDYGCGNGEESIYAARAGARQVVGIDISEVSIENCRRRAREAGLEGTLDFRINDGEALEFGADEFDLAMEYGVLHHVDLDAAMRELARVLKPDGRMICTEALGHNPIIRFYRKRTPDLRTKWEVEHILRKRDFPTMARHFGRIDIRFFHLATLAAVPFRRLPGFGLLLATLEGIDAALLKVPGLRWQAWIAVFVLSEPRKPAR